MSVKMTCVTLNRDSGCFSEIPVRGILLLRFRAPVQFSKTKILRASTTARLSRANKHMDAIVIAGGTPPSDDPLYEETQGGYKSQLNIAGKPMVQWVLDALAEANEVDRVIVAGLPIFADLAYPRSLTVLPDAGGILENMQVGAEELRRTNPQAEYALVISADIPAITGEMVNWLISTSQTSSHDLYYCVIERSVMESRFPGSSRPYIHLKSMEVCGGNMSMIRTSLFSSETPLWNRLIENRQNPLHLAALLGYDTLFYLLVRQLSLEDAAATVSKRLGIDVAATLCPYPEIALDVDKPHQLVALRSILTERESAA